MRKIFLILFLFCHNLLLRGQDIPVQRLSDKVNTKAEEYWPAISADGCTLLFNRLVFQEGLRNEDFYYSQKDSLGNWTEAIPLQDLNTNENEGAPTLSADGRFLIFTSCNNRDSYGSCDLFYSLKIGKLWLPPRNLGSSINTRVWETQPSLSADGTELYFVSNREGGKGGMDIWHSKLLGIDELGTMQWSKPTNLNINTAKNEMSPFIHSDNETLYFSSNGYDGKDQFDIYVSRKQDSLFSKPENIGAPVNTSSDELGFVVNAAGTTAYFSSDRTGSSKDLYSFPIPYNYRPKKVQILQGKVVDAKSGKPLFASLSLQLSSDSLNAYRCLTDFETGSYLLCLTQGKKWQLSVSAKGYFFYTENIDLGYQELPYTHKDIALEPLEKNAKLTLKNIFFDTDKATLKVVSKIELEQVRMLLMKNPSLKIELGGHTDNQGTAEYNQKLSEKRAHTVRQWLVENGIAINRLSAKGYGKTLPIATNETADGRAQNRRTELKVVAY